MVRLPAVAGQFYPGTREGLAAEVNKYLMPGLKRQPAHLAICPHAGYFYSGSVAGEVLSKVEIPRRVLVVGPNHRGLGQTVALMSSGAWQTPLGRVELDSRLGALLLSESSLISEDSEAHKFEHSLEVQVPFLQAQRDDLLLTPLCLSFLSLKECLELGADLARAFQSLDEPVLMLASTDMTHYENRRISG